MRKPFNGNWQPSRGFGSPLIPNDAKYGLHKGIDWPLPVRTPLVAAVSGTVVFAGWSTDAGFTVTIQTKAGMLVKCFHLYRVDVYAGQKVSEGDHIGLSGATGNVTGPHLHFQVEQGGVAIDPAPLLNINEGDDMAGEGEAYWKKRNDEATAVAEQRRNTINVLVEEAKALRAKLAQVEDYSAKATKTAEDRLGDIGKYQARIKELEAEIKAESLVERIAIAVEKLANK